MVSEKLMDRITLVSSLAQHTETVTSCLALCGLMWDFLQFSICYSENQDPLTWKQALLLSTPSVRCVFLSHTLWKYQFTKISLPLGCVPLSLWITVVWVTGDANAAVLLHIALMMQICLRSFHVKPNKTLSWKCSQSSTHFLEFSFCVVWNLSLETFSHICKLLSKLDQVHQETFLWIFDDTSRTVI